jgi:hypothetical protein
MTVDNNHSISINLNYYFCNSTESLCSCQRIKHFIACSQTRLIYNNKVFKMKLANTYVFLVEHENWK